MLALLTSRWTTFFLCRKARALAMFFEMLLPLRRQVIKKRSLLTLHRQGIRKRSEILICIGPASEKLSRLPVSAADLTCRAQGTPRRPHVLGWKAKKSRYAVWSLTGMHLFQRQERSSCSPLVPGAPPIPQCLVEVASHQLCDQLYATILQQCWSDQCPRTSLQHSSLCA